MRLLIPRRRMGHRGQFIPISAMVMFTIVTMMVAVVNVYKVARAKLKVQNLADATALNITSQMVHSLNTVADRNEYLNHTNQTQDPNANHEALGMEWQAYVAVLRQALSGHLSNSGSEIGFNPVHTYYPPVQGTMNWKWPPISFAENTSPMTSGYIFKNQQDARDYASTVHKINLAQKKFAMAYNAFIGARNQGAESSAMGNRGLASILEQDIPELASGPYAVVVWNNGKGPDLKEIQKQAKARTSGRNPWLQPQDMVALNFDVHTFKVAYLIAVQQGVGVKLRPMTKTLTDLAIENHEIQPGETEVGWMELPQNSANLPKIGQPGHEVIGAGAAVTSWVDVPGLGRYYVSAKSTAYVVPGSGGLPAADSRNRYGGDSKDMNGRPVFSPTFWIKLGER